MHSKHFGSLSGPPLAMLLLKAMVKNISTLHGFKDKGIKSFGYDNLYWVDSHLHYYLLLVMIALPLTNPISGDGTYR